MLQSVRTWRDNLTGSKAIWWAALATTLVVAVTVGFFLRGGLHGLYMDDYTMKAWAFDFSKARWRLTLNPIDPNFRPLHSGLTPNLANALPDHELPLRLGIVVVHLANVFLLALLAHRLTGSRFVAVLSGAYFLMPIFANEALLWFTNAVPHTLALLFLLVGFHLLLRCRSLRQDLLLAGCAVIAWVVMVLFVESGLFTLLLLPVFVRMIRHRGEAVSRKAWILALLSTYAGLGIYMLFVLQGTIQIASRGGPTFDLAFIISQRIPQLARQLFWLVSEGGATGPLQEALMLGRLEWGSVPGGWLILAGLILGLCALPFTYPAHQETISEGRQTFTLIVVGLAWVGLALVPLMLLKTQVVAIRTLYTPSAGLALGVAGLLSLMVDRFGRWRNQGIRAALLLTGGILFLSTLTMAGLLRTYQLRWELDQRQLAALRTSVPTLPTPGPIWFVPVALDERSVSAHIGRETKLDRYLVGVFELPWSASAALDLEYGREDINTMTVYPSNRLHLTGLHRSERGRVTSIILQGRVIDVTQLLAFTYQRGRVIVLNPLEVSSSSGSPPTAIDLPLAAQVARKGAQVQSARFSLEQPAKAWTEVSVVLFQRHIIYIASLDRLAADILPKAGSDIGRTELIQPLIKALSELNIDVKVATREADLKAILVERLGR